MLYGIQIQAHGWPRNRSHGFAFYSGGSVMVWGCISHDCKLNLVIIQGNLTGDQYIRDVLQPVVVPHFDNHPLAIRPVYMDDNARHEAETGSRLTNGFCTMSLNSNLIMLSTMPNVIVDVGLPTVDV
jgi:hypothetical protein